MIHQTFDDAGLIADFVQMAEMAADIAKGISPISASTGAFIE